ncbi:MAG: M56 family metallopeptidase [Steroidobacteraceae bacterium]
MAAEALSFLARTNLVLACAVLLVLALRTTMRVQFGARVGYAFWWIVPAAMIATMLPTRTIEIVVEAAPPSTVAAVPAAASGELPAQLPTIALVDVSSMLLGLWLAGVAVMLLVLTLRQRAFVASLGRLSRERDGTLRADATCAGPAILGALWPKLVLPKDFEARFGPSERALVLAHERVHLQRCDARINGLAALMHCICWFNPLAHVAALVLRIDQELACDAVVAAQYPKARRTYAEAMLKTQLTPMNLPVGCNWSANGTHPLKLRIAMLKHDLPGARCVAAGLLAVALACVTTGCAVWAAQPPREVTAVTDSVSPAQSASDAQLLRAVLQGNHQRAQMAIDAGADVNVRSKRGVTVLAHAARVEDMRMLNLLLDHGADVNLTSPGEGNALVAAGRRGHVRAVAALVEHGARVNAIVTEYGTPLVTAVRTGHPGVVKYLVEHGADVSLASPLPAPWDRWGVERTPLEVAVNGNHASIAAYLRSMGAEVKLAPI